MKSPITISIPKPCRELDQHGTVVDKGIYCASCKKVVTDFTTKTQNEIYDIITQSRGEVCGRFYTHHLNTPIVKHKLKTSPFNLKAIAAALASLFGLQAWAGGNSNSSAPAIEQVNVLNDSTATEQSSLENNDTSVVKVRVLDKQTNEPIQYCTFNIVGTDKGGTTDATGYIIMDKADLHENEMRSLTIQALGYDGMTIFAKGLLTFTTIYLTPTSYEGDILKVGLIDYEEIPKIQKPKK